jgi:hypothetical protein
LKKAQEGKRLKYGTRCTQCSATHTDAARDSAHDAALGNLAAPAGVEVSGGKEIVVDSILYMAVILLVSDFVAV